MEKVTISEMSETKPKEYKTVWNEIVQVIFQDVWADVRDAGKHSRAAEDFTNMIMCKLVTINDSDDSKSNYQERLINIWDSNGHFKEDTLEMLKRLITEIDSGTLSLKTYDPVVIGKWYCEAVDNHYNLDITLCYDIDDIDNDNTESYILFSFNMWDMHIENGICFIRHKHYYCILNNSDDVESLYEALNNI